MRADPSPAIASLYVHVPFCAQKCDYCAFYSHRASAGLTARYVRALVREMEMVAGDLKPRTVFFGGGTPSLLSLAQWQAILQAMDRLKLLGAAEWTVECNPATVSPAKAGLWREYGVNRVSMGVQSFDEAMLERLGRIHNRATALASYGILRQAGFDNLGLDLMFAIPGQTLRTWRETLQEAFTLQPEHLSCYELIYEEDTRFFTQLRAGKLVPDEDLACAMYEELLEQTAAHGYQQYEVANFARRDSAPAGLSANSSPAVPALACRHNVNYWRGGSYHGLGPSACGYVGKVRTRNVSNTELYCARIEQGERAIESQEELPPLRRAGEIAAFGLRMNAGWPLAEFRERTGFELGQEWREETRQLVERGWGHLDERQFHLTRQGMRFADAAAELFLK